MFIKYKNTTMHFMLISFIACGYSISCADAQASRSRKALGCPHGVPHYHGSASRQRGGGGTQGPPPTGHVGLSPVARQRSVAQFTALARSQLPKRLKCFGAVGKEVEPSLRIPLDHHRATLDLVIHPVRGDAQRLGELRHCQGPCDP